jgi:hypothetical protein
LRTIGSPFTEEKEILMISSGPLKMTALATAGLLGAGAMAVVQGDVRPGSAAAAPPPGMPFRPGPGQRPMGPMGPPPGFRMQIDPERFQQRRDEFHAALAKKLGVTPEKVETAFREVFQDRLDEAVGRGALTREQADRMLHAWESGTPPRPFLQSAPRRPMGGPPAPLPPPLP